MLLLSRALRTSVIRSRTHTNSEMDCMGMVRKAADTRSESETIRASSGSGFNNRTGSSRKNIWVIRKEKWENDELCGVMVF